MSWSISANGTATEVKAAIAAEAGRLVGVSAEELAEAKPHVEGLLSSITSRKIKLTANGHTSFNETKQEKTYSYVSIVIEGTD